MLGSALLFGTTGTAQALGPAAPPAAVGAARVAVGGAALVLVAAAGGALARRRADRPARTRGAVPWAALAAAAGVAGYQLCFFAGVARTGVAIGTVVALGSAPAITGLLDLVVRGERPERRWAAATALAIAGGALLVLSGGGERGADPLGVLLALGAGASYAVYTVAAKASLERDREPVAVMASAFGIGALLLLPVLALTDTGWLAEPGGVALALYLGLGPTALAYVLFARGLRRLPARTVATLTLAEPLTAALLGVVALGERPGLLAAAGAGLVLLGLVALAGRRDAVGPAARPAAT